MHQIVEPQKETLSPSLFKLIIQKGTLTLENKITNDTIFQSRQLGLRDKFCLIFFFYQSQLIILLYHLKHMSKQDEKDDTTYFNRFASMASANTSQKRMEAAGRLSFDLVNMLELEIQSNKLHVNEVQKQFKLKQRSANDQSSKRINNLLNKKHQIQGELDQIVKEQEKINNLNHSRSERKYFKSEMTEEDLEKIKKIKIQQKKHQMQMEQRAKQQEEHLRKLEEEERELLQKQKKEKNEERLKETAKKIDEIKKRQQERAKKIQEENKRILELKQEKKLHEKLEEHYRAVEQQEQKKKEEIKIALKVQKKINFDDIKEHQKKYQEIMRGQRQERQKKLGQLSRTNIKKYQYTKNLKQVLQQQQKAKKEHLQKMIQIKQKLAKKEEYAQYVRNTYLPNVPIKEDELDKNKTNVNRSVSVAQLYKMGNQYMKLAHQNLANLKGSSVSKVVDQKQEPFKYKDYLKDMKVGRKLSSHKQSRYLQQIDNLMKKENMTQQQKFYKARMLALKLQDSKGRDSQKMIDSINAKIHLLQKIEPTQES